LAESGGASGAEVAELQLSLKTEAQRKQPGKSRTAIQLANHQAQ
jgi:hypothetical protein